MTKTLKVSLILSLPFVLKYLFLLIFVDFGLLSWYDFIEDVFFVTAFGLMYFSIKKNHFISDVLLFVYILYFTLETGSYLAISSNFTSSFMYVLIEAGKDELDEFTSSYLSTSIIFLIVCITILFLFLRKRVFKYKANMRLLVVGFFLVIILVFLKVTGLIENNAYHNIVRGAYGYIQLQNNFNLDEDINKQDILVKNDNEVFVIVLGESTARGHLNLYNYYRETTPFLSDFKDSLYIYNNVISTDVLTLKAVPKMLTSFSNIKTRQPVVNIIDVFNNAGYKTFWLSNQRPISYHDNAISKIASRSNYFKFYNHLIEKHATVLDEVILPKYNEILNTDGRKMIVVRLLGTHFDYEKRYPSSFEKYKTQNVSEEEMIKNHYDNAVLYNDYIVFSILENLKKLNKKSALLYLSDHGENVFDEGEFFGRNEASLTKNMFEIPFILWTSKSFEMPEDFEYKPNRKFMTDHLYESLGHIFGVLHKDMDVSHSMFSNTFNERQRKVVNDIDFDNYFLENNE